jgi:hypothetical protein
MVYRQTKLRNWINPSNIEWLPLSCNSNAIELLNKNPEKIDWDYLSANINAIEILKANPEKINNHFYSSSK